MQLSTSDEAHLQRRTCAPVEPTIHAGPYSDTIHHFADRHLITIAAGATCAYLGDERNLREFLVADETAQRLRQSGHTVISFLIDDSMEALNFRQLRVAVDKDPEKIARFEPWCGRPINYLPDPFGCHASFAEHFETGLLDRLHRLGCHPTLVNTAKLYARGVYKPYVEIVLERYQEIMEFLHARFSGYEPGKLFYPLCPKCCHLDDTQIESIHSHGRGVKIRCNRCEISMTIGFDDLEGKLNWKLDCAARWVIFKIDAEPFSKAYLEPQTGTFAVAQALSREYFGGHEVLPIPYGLVKMENKFSYQLLNSLPGPVLRDMLVESPPTDIKLTRDLVITIASRKEVLPGLSHLEFVKQLLPMWLLTPHSLTPDQRDLVSYGLMFRQHFLHENAQLALPARPHFETETPATLAALRALLIRVVESREEKNQTEEEIQTAVKDAVSTLGEHKKASLHWMRKLIGQTQGVPASRFLMALPLDYLKMLEYMMEIHLYLHNLTPAEQAQTENRGATEPMLEPLLEPLIERRGLAERRELEPAILVS